MKKLLVPAILALVLAISAPAMAQKKSITIAADATWPPMEFIDENKQLVGYSVDYMKAAAEAAGYEV
ncbi:MAG: transporter substrate-binding domain-containing protein, partial [Candidatus Adiutrix sp.]|nr:transporter substrate-binding domain-containing protein [Candidatus Adiutrix sp.]